MEETKEPEVDEEKVVTSVEFNTDGHNAESIDDFEKLGQPKPGFANPLVRKIGLEAANETRRRRKNSGLVVREPDYKRHMGATKENFEPTENMRKVLGIALELRSTKIGDWLEEVELTRSAWYMWTSIPGFKEWWNKHFLEALKSFENEWLTIGIKKMRVDYRYWSDMGEKLFGYYKHLKIEKVGTEEEKALTSELLKLFAGINRKNDSKVIDGEVVRDETIEVTPDMINQLNASPKDGS